MSPTPSTLLDLWEAGLPLAPLPRSVLLLEATGATGTAGWTVGRRDGALLERYCAPAGTIEALADCPGCGAALDVTLDPRRLAAGPARAEVTVAHDGYAVTARPPTVADLRALPTDGSEDELRDVLLGRCVLAATRRGKPVAATDLPAGVVERVEDALDEADPAADLRVALDCGECGAEWTETVDAVALAWSALERTARRLATEVHLLAGAYGWSEREILALSPFRRGLYLSAVAP